ncbi:MAG: class I SAM-dependent methyltransferase [Candidatus Omnitrophota bacterium]
MRGEKENREREKWTQFLEVYANSLPGFAGVSLNKFWEDVFSKMSAGSRILDLATGNGAVAGLAPGIPGKGFDVWAIDYATPKVIAPGINFRQASMETFSGIKNIPNDFDLVTGQFAIEYGETESVLKQIHKVLKDGGKGVFVIHHKNSFWVERARSLVEQINWAMQTGVFEVAQRYVQSPSGANLKSLQAAFEVLQSEINKRKGSKADHEVLSYILRYGLWVFEEVRAGRVSGLADRIEDAKMQWNNTLWVKEHMINTAFDEGSMDGFRKALKASGFDVLKIEPWQVRGQLRMKEQDMIVAWRVEIQKPVAPIEEAQEVVIPVMVIREETTLADITKYLDEMAGRVFHAGPNATLAPAVQMSWKQRLLTLKQKLELVRDGRLMGHPACLGCVNGGICPLVAGLLRGDKTPKEDANCSKAKRPSLTNEEVTQALQQVKTQLDHPALRSEVRITEDQLFSPQEVRIIDAKRQLLKRIYPFLNQEQKQAILHPHILPVLLGVKSAYVAFEAPENRDPEPSTHVVSEAIGKFPQLWQSLGLIFTNNYIVNLEHLMERFQKEGQILVETGVLTPSQLSRFSKGPVDQAFIRDLKGWLVRYIPSIPGREIVQGFVIGYSLEDIRFQHAYVMNSPEMEFVPGLTLLKDVWPGLPLRDARFVIPAATQGAVHAKPLGYVVDTAYGHLAFSKDLGMSAALTARWESVTHETYRQFAALNDFGQAMPPMALRAFHSLSRSETRILSTRRTFLTGLFAVGAIAITGAPIKALAQWHFEKNIFSKGSWAVKGAEDSGPAENSIQTPGGSFSELKILSQGRQVFSVKGNGFLRAIPLPTRGPDGAMLDWGTSFVMPGYWTGGRYLHNPMITKASFEEGPGGTLVLKGFLLDQAGNWEATDFEIVFHPATEKEARMDVSFTPKVLKDFSIDEDRLQRHEGFQAVQASSMNIGKVHDADLGDYQDAKGIQQKASLQKKNELIFNNPAPLGQKETFYLKNEKLSLWRYRPTVFMRANGSNSFTPQGWVANSSDKNDDNIGAWLHFDNAKSAYLKGETLGVFNFTLGATIPGRSEIRKAEVFRDWAGLQAKARESGVSRLLDPAYILHDWMVLEKVNPEFRPFRLIYGATGVDLSNAFLSTDMKEGFFISDYFGWTANTYGGEVAGDFKKLEDSSFRSQLLATEWAEQYRDEKMKWGYAIGDRLHIPERRLAALAVELNALGIEDIRMTQDGQYPVLTFPWRHPLADETTLRMITFVDADITRPSHYVSTLRGNFDGYYQRAGQEIPLDYERDPGFISELQKFLVDGGLFITDDYAYDPAAEMSRERVFTDQGSRFPLGLPRLSLSHDKELADSILELREKGALRDTPADHYGWDVRIRKSVRSEMRNKDQAPREETTKARPAIPTAFMAKVVDSWAKVNKLNLRSEPSPLDVKSVQVNKAGFVFIGDSTEFERAVAAWAGLIDGTEEGYQWMGKAAESQRSMGYGKKQSFVENARMAANYLSENVDWYAYQRGAIVLDYDDSTGNGYVAVLDRGDQGFPVKKGGGLDIEVVEGGFLAQKSESKGDGIAMGRVIKEGALTIISHGQVAEIKEGEKEARKVISQSYDGARAEEVAAFKGAAVIVRFEASRSEVRKAEPASEEAMTAELEAAKRQFKWWSKKIPAWAEGEKQKIPQILKALHEAGFSLRGGTVQLENGEEGARVVFGVLGTPRTPSSVYNKALQIYKDRGGWDAALREAGLDPVVIKQEPGFIELRNMKNGSERKWPAAGPRSEVRQTELKSRVSEKRTSSTVDAYKDTAEFIQKHIVTEDAAIYTVRDIIARELPSAIYELERITELRHLMDESGKRNTPVILWQNMSLGQFFPYFSETLKTQLGVLELSEDPSKWNAQIADLQPGKTRFILIKQKIASSFPGENRDYADYPEEEWDPSVEMGGAKEAGRIAKALGAPIVMVDHSTKEFSNGQKLWADQSHRDGIVPNWVRAGSVNDLGALRGPLTEERSLVLLNANAQTDGKKSLFDDSDVFSKNGQNRQVVINGEKENFVDAFMKVYATATSKGLRRSETRGPGLEKKLEEIFRKAGVTVRRTEIKEKGILHPTPAEAFDAILQAMDIPADGNITILDAGSGQAQMLIRFAMARPDIKKLIGIEYEPGLVQESEKVLQQAVSEGLVRPGQIVIKQGDFNDETSKKLFEETERVYYFHLGTADAGAMIKTFEANLRPGARVVIYPTQEKPDTYRRVALAETGLFEAQHTSRVSIFTRREGIKKFVVSDELAVETLTMDDVTAVEKILRNGNETEKAALREKLESSLPVKQVDISQTPFKTLGSKLYISSDKSLFNPLDPQKTGFAIANRVAQQMKKGEAVLDVGCGTGVQALMALANGAASAVAIDLKPFALLVTLLNAERGGVLEKISVERVDVTKLAEWKAPHLFDRIISNAPAPIDIYGMDPEDREYFVKRHYDSNKHDLNYVFTHGFFSGAGRLLKEESTINFSSFDDIVDIIEQNGFVIRDQVYPADEIVLYTIGKSSEGPARAEARTVPEKNDPKKTVDPAPSVAALSQTIPQRPRDNSGAEQSVRKKLEALKGKFMIMADMADVAKFTDKQLEEFEVMAHLRSEVRFVFTNDGGDTFSRERSDRLQRLQVELGVNRIVITKTGMEDIALNKGERVIHISKGTRDLSVASRKNVYRGRYLSDEVGIVAVMLLYADQHGKPFEKGMMDLSMASAMLRVAIQEFQNSIVFARAA